MAKKNEKRKTPKPNLTDESDKVIICQDAKLTLSDARMERVLLHVYESARNDANRFRLSKHYPAFFSFSGSMLIALLTASFRDVFGIPKGTIELFAWITFVISLLLGFLLLFRNASSKHQNENAERDKTVKDALNKLLKEKQ